jgi:hypothetical protein
MNTHAPQGAGCLNTSEFRETQGVCQGISSKKQGGIFVFTMCIKFQRKIRPVTGRLDVI